MNKLLRIFLIGLLTFSVYHLVRDVFKDILGIHTIIFDFADRDHLWCKPYCASIAISHAIFYIIAISIILKRNKFGILGVIVLISLPFWFSWLFLR